MAVMGVINHSYGSYGSYWHQLSDSELGHHLVDKLGNRSAKSLISCTFPNASCHGPIAATLQQSTVGRRLRSP